MDLLIKNMEMPKEPTYIVIYPEGKWQETTSSAEGRVIELPPHGRLGDLDKVADDISSRSEKARINEDADIADGFMYSAMIIRNAPTVLEASAS